MKKSVCILFFSMLLFGCVTNDEKLDTANLENITNETNENLPIDYRAENTEEAINALPYKVTLPNLPNGYNPFEVTLLQDVKRDGKLVKAEFTSSKSSDISKKITIFTTNKEIEYSGHHKEVQITRNVIGNVLDQNINFKYEGVYYHIEIDANDRTGNGIQEQLISLSKQMVQKK